MRPVLRPGVRLLRRDVRTLQAGLDWPGLAAFADVAALRAVVDALDGVRTCDEVLAVATSAGASREQAEAALALLVDHGVVVDQTSTVRPLDHDDAEWAALWLLRRTAADVSLAARRRRTTRVQVRGAGQVAGSARAALVAARAKIVGVRADVVVLADDTVPRRNLADPLVRAGRPHVWAHIRDTVAVLGPFVVPGSTPCLRCVDSALAQRDPAWPTLVTAATRPHRRVPACDPALAGLLGAWAAYEISLWLAGVMPLTVAATIELAPSDDGPVTRRFEVHPECGCGWPPAQATMGA